MTTQDLQRLVAAHAAVYEGLLGATTDLDGIAWATPTGCPGWDVHDQLAHCIGTERLMLGHQPAEVDVPDRPYLRSDFARLVERDVEARRNVTAEFLREEAEVTFVRRRRWLDRLSPDDLDGQMPTPIGPMPGRRGLRIRLFDLTCHEEDVRRALGLPAAEGPHVDVAVGTALRSLAAGLAQRLDGVRGVVAVRVNGGADVGLDVATGRFHAQLDEAPDVTIGCTARQVLALTGGRSDAPPFGDLDVEGDLALAERVVAAAGVTP
ncbi:MAG: maleylpyruvate isomerase family mycothiol-dependent enzyme [Egicoccus sp.]